MSTVEIKAIVAPGNGGLWDCEKLRITYCLDNRLTDGGGVVRLSCRPCTLLSVGILMVLISVGGSFNPRTVMRLEQLSKL
jgi:hypothetical protein